MNIHRLATTVSLFAVSLSTSLAQAVISGKLVGPRFPGSTDLLPYSAVVGVGGLDGPDFEPRAFRTWETAPAGWYQFRGGAGNWTLAFSGPAHFMRPLVLLNIHARPGDAVNGLNLTPQFDFFCFHEGEWDPKPATDYFQIFVARGRSLTHVGFRLAHDGLDGFGPQSQNVLVSVHRRSDGTPDRWPQVGPSATVLNVDSGGGKNYIWSAGWNSGEVPLQPGETYAVHLRPEIAGNKFQAFWRSDSDLAADCYRLGVGSNGFQKHDLWLGIGTDNDGLLIPCNKRVHRQFGEFAGFANKWSQTYVAQGRALAAAYLYAAVGGAQPPLSRQRVVVRTRQGGPSGPVVGLQKIAIGNGNYTGDASWGVFCAAFAPGEVPLSPGETYALEFESIENYETLHGFVNIKGQVSDDRPGFNPYRKHAPDSYPHGTAFKFGRDKVEFDLDLQVIEYEVVPASWRTAVDAQNLLLNGDMETADPANTDASPASWNHFSIELATTHTRRGDGQEMTNHFARVSGAPDAKSKLDGGFVQRVANLNHLETYRLAGRVRSSWAVDDQRQCSIGYDPTGQVESPSATTIVWTSLPGYHGIFVPYLSDPIRPATNAISVWLRARASAPSDTLFKADFDDFTLHRVQTTVPRR